jgi:hypothetical protein
MYLALYKAVEQRSIGRTQALIAADIDVNSEIIVFHYGHEDSDASNILVRPLERATVHAVPSVLTSFSKLAQT